MPTIPDDLTTKLSAVNTLLQTIGQAPVASLDASLSVDVAAAVQALDEIDRRIQIKGWHWNREDNWQLSPDDSGQIALPANYLWVGNAYCDSAPVRISERGRQLYNRDTHSFVFTDPVSVDMVIKLQWEEMPEYARQAIVEAAGEVFQVRLQGSSIIERVAEKAVQGASAFLEQREDEADEQNNVGGNRFVDRVFNRGPRRRY